MASTRERERADGTVAYIALFRHNGRQTSETFDNPKARERFIRNIDRVGVEAALQILDAQEDTAGEHVPTLTELALEHASLITNASDYTRKRYRSYARNDFGAMGDLPVDVITNETIEKWVGELQAAGQSPKTIKNKHGFLSGVMKRAVRRKLRAGNPCDDVSLPKVRKTEMVALDPSELATLISCVPARWRPLVALLGSTGMRWGEATALQPHDIDVDHLRITVRRAWKLNDDGWESDVTKTVESDRDVTISPELADLLLPLMAGRAPTSWLFRNSRGGPVRHNTWHETVWQPAVKFANGRDPWPDRQRAMKRTSQWHGITPADPPLGKWPRIHDLRHSAISNMTAAGVDPKAVQAQAGHESITTTLDRYGHVTAPQRAAIQRAQSGVLTLAFPTIEDGDEPAQLEA